MLPENAPAEFQSGRTFGTPWSCPKKGRRTDRKRNRSRFAGGAATAGTNRTCPGVYKTNFTDRGMCADICIHDKGDGNPHAHIMLTMRSVTPEGLFAEVPGLEWEKIY